MTRTCVAGASRSAASTNAIAFGGESVAEWSAREGVFELLRRTVAGARPDLSDPAPLFLTTTLLWTQLHGIASLTLDRPTFPWPPTAALLAQVLGGLRSRTSDGG